MRLVASLAVVLVLSLALAAGLACAQAIRSVRTELLAALSVGAQAATDLAGELAPDADPLPQLSRLVATFNGNRHVRAVLLDGAGKQRAASHLLASPQPPPGWFVGLVGPDLPTRRIPAGAFTVVLSGDPVNEASEVWDGFGDDAIVLAAFCLLSAVLTLTTVGRALRPLEQLSAAFPRLAAGAFGTRVAERGPPELLRLTHGFNEMAARLAAMEERNHRLQAQLETLQDEERAEVARDLHDEVGPFLFAAHMAAANIRAGAERDNQTALAADAEGLQELIGHMQGSVRSLLRRLRPSPAADLGLGEAIGGLADFWRSRHPTPRISLDIEVAEEPDTVTAATVYRFVQEGLANALRHGRPGRIEVSVRAGTDGLIARVTDDGAGASGDSDGDGGGLGLLGMRERMAALGGSLAAGAAPGQGWVVTARLPWPRPAGAA
jgi:two-component system sensor histidine kinase UhpB